MSDYIEGQMVRLSAEFRDYAGTLADPDAVTLKYKIGSGSLQTVTPTKDSTGTYHYNLLLSAPGLYQWRWQSTGGVPTADQGQFVVAGAAL